MLGSRHSKGANIGESIDRISGRRPVLRRLHLLCAGVVVLGLPLPACAGDQTAPSLSEPPAVVDAPGRGILGSASAHSAILPTLYALDAQPIEQISPLVQRQMLHGTQSTFVKWTVKKGGVFPLHHHANEQITWITQVSVAPTPLSL